MTSDLLPIAISFPVLSLPILDSCFSDSFSKSSSFEQEYSVPTKVAARTLTNKLIFFIDFNFRTEANIITFFYIKQYFTIIFIDNENEIEKYKSDTH